MLQISQNYAIKPDGVQSTAEDKYIQTDETTVDKNQTESPAI